MSEPDIPDEVKHPDFTEQPTMTLWRRVLLRPAVPGIPTPPEVIDVPTGTSSRYLTNDLIRRGLVVLAVAALVLGGVAFGLGHLAASSAPATTGHSSTTATPTSGAWQAVWHTHGTGDATVTPPQSAISATPRFQLVWTCGNSGGYLKVTIMQGGKSLPVAFVLCPGDGGVSLTQGTANADTTDTTLSAGPFSVHMQAPNDASWTLGVEVPRPT